jgi:drug/metabolite transporter (DMT)-like permease
VAASQSGNLIRIGHAHAAAMAAWRLGLASLVLAPIAGRELASLARLSWRERGLVLLAGASLAAHLTAWIAAVQLTTVANAAIFFSVNPVLTATAAHFVFRERATARLLGSIALGLAGVAIIGWEDLRLSSGHLAGDAVAILCSVFFTGYFLAGKRLRRTLPTAAYVTAVYGVAAALAFAALPVLGVPASGYDAQTWASFALLALVPTMIGHTSLNHALRHIDAGRISTATLSEPALAGAVAYFAWGERPSAAVLVGYAVVVASVVVLTADVVAIERRGVEAQR